ncbi:ABC transporter substrate-binding protein [Enemella sp. A6]|uniref:ABC transporter substrate-binding protein n=1 Tax=Enemella sp. A6 TaxID=3440152 RepID=UPI003EBC5EB8
MRKLLLLLAVPLLALTACATSRDEVAARDAGAGNTFAEPVTLTNCDMELTFTAPPQRIISMNDHVTEVLLEMGLGDRIVGMGYGKATPLPQYAEQWQKISKLADEYPTMEQIIDAEADLVVGGLSSAFNEKEGRSRELMAEHEIPSFLFTEYCATTSFDLEMLRTDYTNLGKITGNTEAADTLVEQVTGEMAAINKKVAGAEPVPTFIYDSGDKEVYTVGGVGVGNLILTQAGGKNLFADGERPYSKTSWEQVAERSPEVIVVLDYGEQSAAEKIAFLKQQPLMKTTPAIKNERIVVVPLDDFFESPRMTTSTRTIAEALHPELVK